MKYDNREPCKTCPYRRDVPVGTWHKSEFENLLAHDKDEVRGNQFGCHQYRTQPEEERKPCVGWLLDQRNRGTPSIRLRITLCTHQDARTQYEEMTDGGNELYESIEEMARVNIPIKRRPRKRKT